MTVPWPIRSVVAGATGTAAMTMACATQRRLRRNHSEPLDYDESLVPGKIVASITHLGRVTDREDNELGVALRWGYASAFGIWHGLSRRRIQDPCASLLFGATLMSATFSLHAVARTNPARRWPLDVMATCIGRHVAYVLPLAAVDDVLRRSAITRND